jgi:hypothetical protein
MHPSYMLFGLRITAYSVYHTKHTDLARLCLSGTTWVPMEEFS